MERQKLTEAQICDMALMAQDGCNPAGISFSFHDAICSLRDLGKDVRRHPAIILYMDKLCDMTGLERELNLEQYREACDYCEKVIKAEPKSMVG